MSPVTHDNKLPQPVEHAPTTPKPSRHTQPSSILCSIARRLSSVHSVHCGRVRRRRKRRRDETHWWKVLDLFDAVVVPPRMLQDERQEGVNDEGFVAVSNRQGHHHHILTVNGSMTHRTARQGTSARTNKHLHPASRIPPSRAHPSGDISCGFRHIS